MCRMVNVGPHVCRLAHSPAAALSRDSPSDARTHPTQLHHRWHPPRLPPCAVLLCRLRRQIQPSLHHLLSLFQRCLTGVSQTAPTDPMNTSTPRPTCHRRPYPPSLYRSDLHGSSDFVVSEDHLTLNFIRETLNDSALYDDQVPPSLLPAE